MRWSKSLISTLREDPQEAEIPSHKLMLRAGIIRRLSGGLYIFTPFGLRALHKVEKIVREEMDRAGAQEILMPALQPIELWEKSGRANTMGASMFKLKDRQERLMVLGPTHEEVVTDYITREINSYRQLPCIVYQVQTKFRDEIRPRFGLMRAKEFIMKDAYSFDVSSEAADGSYKAMYDAYTRIFARCGLRAKPVEADTGDMGGNHSHEFMVPADSGEDAIVECTKCSYAANTERAERRLPEMPEAEEKALEEVSTPNVTTIAQVAKFLKVEESALIKTLIYVVDGKPIAVLIPGNRELNEIKLKHVVGGSTVEAADAETVENATNAPVGFAGPVGLKIPIYCDVSLRTVKDAVAGANKKDTHILHVSIPRDAGTAQFHDLVTCDDGDLCPRCSEVMRIARGIEVGHVFKLGTKYTEAFESTFLDDQGQAQTMIMGCGIGVTRTLQAVVEQNFDKDGIVWPISVSPYQVALLPLDAAKDTTCKETAEMIENELSKRGIDVFTDDRDERPGVKFKDADLIGFSIRVVVGTKSLEKGGVEVRSRKTGEISLVAVENVIEFISDLIKNENN